MSFGEKIITHLKQLGSFDRVPMDRRKRNAKFSVEKKIDNARVRVIIADFDKYSFVVCRISVQVDEAQSNRDVIESLKARAKKIIDSIDYLTETFSLIEVDARHAVAQLRSQKPVQKQPVLEDYEILITGERSLSFERFEKRPDIEQRESIPFVLAEDILVRLIDDLAAVWRVDES
jgi:hypothetical protein